MLKFNALFLILSLLFSFGVSANEANQTSSATEDSLLTAINKINNGQIKDALGSLESLIAEKPNYKLAQMVYGDALAALAGNPVQLSSANLQASSGTADLLWEAKSRIKRRKVLAPEAKIPAYFLEMGTNTKHVLLIDLKDNRLYLYDYSTGTPSLLGDFYAGIGKAGALKLKRGDLRTPVGVYKVTHWLPDNKLPELYGAGAFPTDYPNQWDSRLQRTGSGIWLHGVPRATFTRAPRSSKGCVTVSNADVKYLKKQIGVTKNTPIIMADGVEWLTQGELASRRQSRLNTLRAWINDWQSLDVNRYLSHYAPDFTSAGYDHARWVAHKTRVSQNKTYINVELTDITVVDYPGEPMFVTEFTQNYQSNNYDSANKKRQYWRLQPNGQWKIIDERSVDGS